MLPNNGKFSSEGGVGTMIKRNRIAQENITQCVTKKKLKQKNKKTGQL